MVSRMRWLASLLAAFALMTAACGPAAEQPVPAREAMNLSALPKNANGYVDISVEQLGKLPENKNFTLVNVHIPYEGEISKTDLFIPYDDIANQQDKLPGKDAPIVLYCRSGSMSITAAEALVKLGYTNVAELDGGFTAWKAAGYELLNKQ